VGVSRLAPVLKFLAALIFLIAINSLMREFDSLIYLLTFILIYICRSQDFFY